MSTQTMKYRFAEFSLDTRARVLHRSGRRIALEPKVLETLLFLIEHRETVVTKAELAAGVWRADRVTDSAIARCIAVARRALGDDARESQWIRTVYGRGYHFVGEVEEQLDESWVPETTNSAPSSSRRRELSLKIRSWRAAAAAGVVLALVVVGLASSRPERSRTFLEREPGSPIDLIARVDESDDDLQLLAVSLLDLMRLSLLDGSVPLRDVRVEGVPSSAPESSVPKVVLHVAPGDLQGYSRVEATLEPGADGAETVRLVSYVIPYLGDGSDLNTFLAVRDSVVGQLSQLLRVTLEPKGRWVPRSAEAWRLYLLANFEFALECDHGLMEDRLRASLHHDPEFAPAWLSLAAARVSRAAFCGQPLEFSTVEAELDQASALEPDWAMPQQFRTFLRIYDGEIERAWREIRRVHEQFPNNPHVLVRQAEVLRYAGFLERASELTSRVVEELPHWTYLTDSVPYSKLYAQDWDGFLATLPGRSTPYFQYYRGYAEWMRGNRAAAVAALRPAAEAAEEDVFGQLSSALLSIVESRPEEALRTLEELGVRREDRGLGDGEISFKIGQLLVLAGSPENGVRQLQKAVDLGFFCVQCLEADPVLSSSKLPGLNRVLDSARVRQRNFQRELLESAETGGSPRGARR